MGDLRSFGCFCGAGRAGNRSEPFIEVHKFIMDFGFVLVKITLVNQLTL